MRNSVSPSKSRERSPSLRENSVPMWDSSDPSRAPPALPLMPGSPSLNAVSTGNGPVSGSPFKISSGPIKQSFSSRNYSSINEERLSEILELSRDIKAQNLTVEAAVREALDELNDLARPSNDSSSQLGPLIEAIENTRASTDKTESLVRENVSSVLSSLDVQHEAHQNLTTVTQALLEKAKDHASILAQQEAHLKKLLDFSESQTDLIQASTVSKSDLDHVAGAKTSQILEEFSQFSETMNAQQHQTITILKNLKDYFDNSANEFDRFQSQVSNVVRDTVNKSTTEICKDLKTSHDKSLVQLKVLDENLMKVQTSLQASIAKAINNAATISRAEVPTHDHLIPDIVTRLTAFEENYNSLQNKNTSSIVENLAEQSKDVNEISKQITVQTKSIDTLSEKFSTHSSNVDGFSEKVLSQTQDLSTLIKKVSDQIESSSSSHDSIATSLDASLQDISSGLTTLATNEDVSNVIFKVEEFAQSIGAHYQSLLQSAETRVNNAEKRAQAAEEEALIKASSIEQKVEDFRARCQELEKTAAIQSSKIEATEAAYEKEVAAHAKSESKLEAMDARCQELETNLAAQTLLHEKSQAAHEQEASLRQILEKKLESMEARYKELEATLAVQTLKTETASKAHEQEMASRQRAEQKLEDVETRSKELERQMSAQASSFEATRSGYQQESELKSATLTQDYEQKLSVVQKKFVEAEAATKALKKEMALLKYMNTDIEKHEVAIQALKDDATALQCKKERLSQEVTNLNTMYSVRVDELRQLESRVEAFERRLSQTILDRSKNILGSATMAIINSADHRASPSYYQPAEGEKPRSRRHLSMAPLNSENVAKEIADEKENDTLSVLKRGSPLTKSSQRSVSLVGK